MKVHQSVTVTRRARGLLHLGCALAVVAVFAATKPAQAASADTVTLGTQSWQGVTIKTEVAAQILNHIGYTTETFQGNSSLIIASAKKGQVHVLLGNWLPSMEPAVKSAIKSGKVEKLTVNLPEARQGLAVPDYVWNAGVHSIADLAQHGDRFDRTVYGIGSGSRNNQIINEAISANMYGLKGWKLVPSSTAGMLSEVEKATRDKDWIVFNGWKPHWMDIKYDFEFLDDPKKMWGERSEVWTLANSDFVKANPNAARFFRQFVLPAKTQSRWIYEYSYKDRDKAEVANEWILGHLDLVATWLDGVRSADCSTAAIAALKAAYES